MGQKIITVQIPVHTDNITALSNTYRTKLRRELISQLEEKDLISYRFEKSFSVKNRILTATVVVKTNKTRTRRLENDELRELSLQ